MAPETRIALGIRAPTFTGEHQPRMGLPRLDATVERRQDPDRVAPRLHAECLGDDVRRDTQTDAVAHRSDSSGLRWRERLYALGRALASRL